MNRTSFYAEIVANITTRKYKRNHTLAVKNCRYKNISLHLRHYNKSNALEDESHFCHDCEINETLRKLF